MSSVVLVFPNGFRRRFDDSTIKLNEKLKVWEIFKGGKVIYAVSPSALRSFCLYE